MGKVIVPIKVRPYTHEGFRILMDVKSEAQAREKD